MTISHPPSADGRDRRGRSPWWYYGVGLALFAAGFGLAALGAVANWRWLQIGAFCMGVIAVGTFWRGIWLAFRVRRARYWEWFDEQQARNVDALESLRRPPSSSGPL
jgi:hypothetical protein